MRILSLELEVSSIITMVILVLCVCSHHIIIIGIGSVIHRNPVLSSFIGGCAGGDVMAVGVRRVVWVVVPLERSLPVVVAGAAGGSSSGGGMITAETTR